MPIKSLNFKNNKRLIIVSDFFDERKTNRYQQKSISIENIVITRIFIYCFQTFPPNEDKHFKKSY